MSCQYRKNQTYCHCTQGKHYEVNYNVNKLQGNNMTEYGSELDNLPRLCDSQVHMLKSKFNARFGNHLFQYASILGIAASQNMVPVLPPRRTLFTAFNITKHLKPESCKKGRKIVAFETNGGSLNHKFNPMSQILGYVSRRLNVHVVIRSHLMSWKYFQNIQNQLRSRLKFIPSIRLKAEKFLDKNINDKRSDVTLIGVHIRMTDREKEWGNKTKYLRAATKFYKEKYTNVQFVVCSDNIKYWKKNFPNSDSVFSVDYQMEPWVDMAILSLCDHTIITVGTFSWWAGWLAGGDVVYYKNMNHIHNPPDDTDDDFFPSHWIPILS